MTHYSGTTHRKAMLLALCRECDDLLGVSSNAVCTTPRSSTDWFTRQWITPVGLTLSPTPTNQPNELSALARYTVSTAKNMDARQRISFYFGPDFGGGPEAEQIGNLN